MGIATCTLSKEDSENYKAGTEFLECTITPNEEFYVIEIILLKPHKRS
jgi:hypothetical protein